MPSAAQHRRVQRSISAAAGAVAPFAVWLAVWRPSQCGAAAARSGAGLILACPRVGTPMPPPPRPCRTQGLKSLRYSQTQLALRPPWWQAFKKSNLLALRPGLRNSQSLAPNYLMNSYQGLRMTCVCGNTLTTPRPAPPHPLCANPNANTNPNPNPNPSPVSHTHT